MLQPCGGVTLTQNWTPLAVIGTHRASFAGVIFVKDDVLQPRSGSGGSVKSSQVGGPMVGLTVGRVLISRVSISVPMMIAVLINSHLWI